MGNSLTVEQRTLTPSVLVRIQVPQPNKNNNLTYLPRLISSPKRPHTMHTHFRVGDVQWQSRIPSWAEGPRLSLRAEQCLAVIGLCWSQGDACHHPGKEPCPHQGVRRGLISRATRQNPQWRDQEGKLQPPAIQLRSHSNEPQGSPQSRRRKGSQVRAGQVIAEQTANNPANRRGNQISINRHKAMQRCSILAWLWPPIDACAQRNLRHIDCAVPAHTDVMRCKEEVR